MPTIESERLSISVGEHGSREGGSLLLHGWPDEAFTGDSVIEPLVDAGRRVIAPSLRRFAETKLEDDVAKTGYSAMLVIEVTVPIDAFGIDALDVARHDWNSNATEALAVGWLSRIGCLAVVTRLAAGEPAALLDTKIIG